MLVGALERGSGHRSERAWGLGFQKRAYRHGLMLQSNNKYTAAKHYIAAELTGAYVME